VDVAAPGGGDLDPTGLITKAYYSILSLNAAGSTLGIPVGQKYKRMAGTSMAAPHVSGLAALIRSKYPTWSNEQVRQVIRLGADDLGASGFDIKTGYGRVNALKSLKVSPPLEVQITSYLPQASSTLPPFTLPASIDIYGTVRGRGSYPGPWNTA